MSHNNKNIPVFYANEAGEADKAIEAPETLLIPVVNRSQVGESMAQLVFSHPEVSVATKSEVEASEAVRHPFAEVSSVEYPNHSGGALIDATGNRVLEFTSGVEQESSIEAASLTKAERVLANEAIKETIAEFGTRPALFSEGAYGELVVNDALNGQEIHRSKVQALHGDKEEYVTAA